MKTPKVGKWHIGQERNGCCPPYLCGRKKAERVLSYDFTKKITVGICLTCKMVFNSMQTSSRDLLK